MNLINTKPSLGKRLLAGLNNFFTAPASPLPLAVFRIGIASVLVLQALSIAGNLQELYGERAIVQWAAVGAPGYHPWVPHVGWLSGILSPLGITAAQALQGVYLLYVLGLSCLLIGWRTNIAAGIAWITHLMMSSSGFMTIYGVDQFANIALFYLTWMPVGAALSADCSAGRSSDEPSITARIAIRVLQLHLCIAYVASGLDKAAGEQWWNGEAVWRAVNLPELAQFDMMWLASVPLLAKMLCWGTLALEAGYPLILIPKLRKPMALGVISMHVGIALSMGLVSFSAVMCVLTGSAFLFSAEPQPATIAARTAQRTLSLQATTTG